MTDTIDAAGTATHAAILALLELIESMPRTPAKLHLLVGLRDLTDRVAAERILLLSRVAELEEAMRGEDQALDALEDEIAGLKEDRHVAE